ncbi:protein ABHD11 isoform X2 [Bufo gargarizans]|uniref:protein ABHD11 isoform X2 n=1 Tax=Bufo gargarizans TaxID=30331 RepID=UPI001CF53804|nr:protein ABHD11 isoform X2 [Bufo gargarizans]
MPLLACYVYTGGSRPWGLLTRIAFRASPRPLSLTQRRTHAGVVSLSYDVFEGKSPGPPLVLLHGLFGSKSNFQSIARALVRRIDRKVLTLDARNHGSSPHCDTITYPAMSDDVRHLLRQLNISSCVLIGHSMGGKTAMTLALSEEASVRQFLLTNLVQENGHFKWRVNLDAISNHLQDLLDFPEFHTSYPGPTLFLGGAHSPYISSENYPEIERLFPCANIEYIEGAGHWVHAEQPHDFLNAICSFVEST